MTLLKQKIIGLFSPRSLGGFSTGRNSPGLRIGDSHRIALSRPAGVFPVSYHAGVEDDYYTAQEPQR